MGGKPRQKPTPTVPRGQPGNFNIYSSRMAKALAINRAKTSNVTYVLVGKPYEGLKQLRALCGFASDQELVRHALTTIAWLIEQKTSGSSLQLVDKEGKTVQVPWRRLLKPGDR